MNAPRTQGNGQIVRGEQEGPTLQSFLMKHTEDFARVLPKHMTPDRMMRLALSAVRTTRDLAKCSIPSFASSLMACSVLGLEPNTPLGHAYLIPFRRGSGYECQLIVGYKGLIELMYRSGAVANVKCTPVFQGDVFSYEYGLHPDITHSPGKDPERGVDPRTLTHVYPVVRLREGGADPIWDVLTRGQIEQRRKRSKASSNGPWVSDYVAMAMKTGIRAVATWVPSSTERPALVAATAYEEANERGRGGQAIAALGEAAQESLDKMGAFPVDEEPEAFDSEVVDREPGDDR